MENDTHAFVIRIWHESIDSEGKITAWRGSIDYVSNHERLYFYDIDGIPRFIREQLGFEKEVSHHRWDAWINRIRNGLRRLRQK